MQPATPLASGVSDATPLLRQLGIVSATALVVSNMIGTGIFTTTGFLAGDLGAPSLVLGIWLVGAIFALAGAFSYSELGINFPASGGEYVYLTQAYGPTWGFMSGWVSFFAGFSAPIAAAALAFSDYLSFFHPSISDAAPPYWSIGSGQLSLRLGGAQLVAMGLIAAFTLLNVIGVKPVARVQNVLTATKILVVLCFIAFGFLAGSGNFEHFSQPAVRTSSHPLLAQFAISLFFVYFGYSGWNAATYVAEELRRPERTLPIALAFGTLLVTALYLGLNMVFIYATPLESMKGVVAVGSLAAERLFGSHIGGLFSLLMAIAITSTVNAMVTIGPRVYYAMAKNGAFVKAAAHVHPRWRTPVWAILSQGLCAMLMTMTSFPDLVVYIGFTLTFFTVMSVSSLFVFRRRPNWHKLRVVSFAFPLIPALFVLAGAVMIVVGATLQPTISVAAVITIITGTLVYRSAVRKRAGVPLSSDPERN